MPYRATWVRGPLRAGWRVDGAHPKEFLFDRADLKTIPLRLRDPAIQPKLKAVAGAFGDYVLQAEGNPKLFQLVSDNGGWQYPWELLLDAAQHPYDLWRIAFARRLKTSQEIAPARLDHPLRLVILRGDPLTGTTQELLLGDEVATVNDAWNDLSAAARASFTKPVDIEANRATLETDPRIRDADVLWYVGHGRGQPKPGLLFCDNTWVTPDELFRPFAPGRAPLFAVLMACDTAAATDDPDSLEQPAFARAAFKAGVCAVLAMQAPIGDLSSRLLAREIFTEIAAGASPSIALARARTVLRDQVFRGKNAVDWAAPVVWSAIDDSKRWTWNYQSAERARHQLFGRDALQAQLAHLETAGAGPTAPELEAAGAWTKNARTWVRWKNGEGESLARAQRILIAVQHLVPDVVLVFDLHGEAPERALHEWADLVNHSLRPQVHPDEWVDFVNGLRNPAAGWRHLEQLSGVTIGILGAPAYEPAHWFWEPLDNLRENARVIVFSTEPFTGSPSVGWSIENLTLAEAGTSVALQALQSAPRLARAVAVLRQPLRRTQMELVEPDSAGASNAVDWSEANNVLVTIADGLLMADSAADVIREQSTEDEMREGHLDCYEMLRALPESVPRFEEMAQHLRLGGAVDLHADLVSLLTTLYRYQNRPHAAARLFDELGVESLDPNVYLYAAWALTALGRNEESGRLLAQTFAETPRNQAWKHGLTADNLKAAGDRDGALQEIEEAISVCAAANETRLWRNFRQDRARILQFLFYKPEEARDLYLELLKEWKDDPDAELDVAIVRRNLAECYTNLAKGPGDPLLGKAANHLEEALAVANKYPGYPLRSEVLYEESKLLDRLAKAHEADEKLDASLAAARDAGYHQMVGIATARIFWRRERFTLQRWTQIEEMLAVHWQHGWPVRTLVDGRLAAAVTLQKNGDDVAALEQLRRNEATLASHPAFIRGSDRERRAKTAAGIDVFTRHLGISSDAWEKLRSQDWAREYLASVGAETSEDIWNGPWRL